MMIVTIAKGVGCWVQLENGPLASSIIFRRGVTVGKFDNLPPCRDAFPALSREIDTRGARGEPVCVSAQGSAASRTSSSLYRRVSSLVNRIIFMIIYRRS